MSFGETLQRQETGRRAIELPPSKELYDILNDFIDEVPPGGQSGRPRTSRVEAGTTMQQRQSKTVPEDGFMTSQDGDTRTTLSWQTTDRGPMKSVTVSKETITRPASAFQPETERRERQRPLPVDDFPDAVDRRHTFGPPVYLERRTFESHTKARTIAKPGHRRKGNSGNVVQTGYLVDSLPDQRRRVFSPQWTSSSSRPLRPTAPRRPLYCVSDAEEPLTWLEEQTRILERRRQGEGVRRKTLPRTGSGPLSDMEGFGGVQRTSHETRLRTSHSNVSLDNLRHQTTLEPPRFSEEHRRVKDTPRTREAAEDAWRSRSSFDHRRRWQQPRSPFDVARSDDVEVISLHPIGCGIYHLEPETDGNLTHSTRSLYHPQVTSTVGNRGSGKFSSAKSTDVVDQRIAVVQELHHTGTSASFADRKSPGNYVTHVGASSAPGVAPESALNTLTRGVECSVLYLGSFNAGNNLSGRDALSRAIKDIFESGRSLPRSTIVQFKASVEGITLTDNSRRLFYRRFFPVETLSFCASDPSGRWWTVHSEDVTATGRAFGFVARKPGVTSEDACHVLLEIDPTHPVDVIVNFVTNALISHGQQSTRT